jgi:hypothetical protein
LVAKLIETNEKRSIAIFYTNPLGETQIGLYRGGYELKREVTLSRVSFRGVIKYLSKKDIGPLPKRELDCIIYKCIKESPLLGYVEAYGRLGSELKKQIPSDWLPILGKWFDHKSSLKKPNKNKFWTCSQKGRRDN